MKVLAAAAMSVSLLDPVFAQTAESNPATRRAADAPPAQTLVISRNGSRPPTQGAPENFTGVVRVDPLFQPTGPARASGAYVTFEPGARSAWHTHPMGQTLIVTAGVGRVQRWGDPIEEIRPGDVVWIPPGQKHWHGAAPSTSMTHMAVQERVDGRTVDWLEKVSDEQYGQAPAARVMASAAPAAVPAQPTRVQRMFGDVASSAATAAGVAKDVFVPK